MRKLSLSEGVSTDVINFIPFVTKLFLKVNNNSSIEYRKNYSVILYKELPSFFIVSTYLQKCLNENS